jgi:hypothetical protein
LPRHLPPLLELARLEEPAGGNGAQWNCARMGASSHGDDQHGYEQRYNAYQRHNRFRGGG